MEPISPAGAGAGKPGAAPGVHSPGACTNASIDVMVGRDGRDAYYASVVLNTANAFFISAIVPIEMRA